MIQSLVSERACLSISNDAIRLQNRTFRTAIAQISQIIKMEETAEGDGAARVNGKNGIAATAEIPAVATNGSKSTMNNRNDLMGQQALLQAAALSSSPASSARHAKSKFDCDISPLEMQSILLRHRLQQRQQINMKAQQMMMAAGDNGGVGAGAGASGMSYNTFDGIQETQQMQNLTNVMSGMNNSNNSGVVVGGNNNFHFSVLNSDNNIRLQQLLVQNRGMMNGIRMQNSNIAAMTGGVGGFGTVSPINNNHGSSINDMSSMFSHNSGSSDLGAVGGSNFGGGVGMNSNSSNPLLFGSRSGSM